MYVILLSATGNQEAHQKIRIHFKKLFQTLIIFLLFQQGTSNKVIVPQMTLYIRAFLCNTYGEGFGNFLGHFNVNLTTSLNNHSCMLPFTS